jgi:23S rRNA (guanosine2251-2'-O)-methyltransferase
MASAGIGDSVEGVHAVAAALAAGRLRTLHVERSRLRNDEVGPIVAAARIAGIDVVLEDDVRPLAATAAPQGVVAHARPIPFLDLDELVHLNDPPVVLVLDHLEDPRNIGAIARSALAAGVPGMVVSTRRAGPIGATAFKAAAGALEHVRVATVSSIPEALRRLSKAGLWLVGLAGEAGTSLWNLDLLTEPVAIVVGAEGSGLHRLTAERCDVLVEIPMAGGVESLNASVAASLAMFEVARARTT